MHPFALGYFLFLSEIPLCALCYSPAWDFARFVVEPTSIMGHDVVLTRESSFRTFQTHIISIKIQCNTCLSAMIIQQIEECSENVTVLCICVSSVGECEVVSLIFLSIRSATVTKPLCVSGGGALSCAHLPHFKGLLLHCSKKIESFSCHSAFVW